MFISYGGAVIWLYQYQHNLFEQVLIATYRNIYIFFNLCYPFFNLSMSIAQIEINWQKTYGSHSFNLFFVPIVNISTLRKYFNQNVLSIINHTLYTQLSNKILPMYIIYYYYNERNNVQNYDQSYNIIFKISFQ